MSMDKLHISTLEAQGVNQELAQYLVKLVNGLMADAEDQAKWAKHYLDRAERAEFKKSNPPYSREYVDGLRQPLAAVAEVLRGQGRVAFSDSLEEAAEMLVELWEAAYGEPSKHAEILETEEYLNEGPR